MYGALLGSTAVRAFLSSHHAARDQLSFILALRKLCNHPSFFTGSDQFNQVNKAQLSSNVRLLFAEFATISNENDRNPILPMTLIPTRRVRKNC